MFSAGSYSGFKAFFLLQGRQEQIEEVFHFISDWWMCFALFRTRDAVPYYVYRKLAAKVKHFMQKALHHPYRTLYPPNDITYNSKSVLVAAQYVGKTTFIRAIGLNLLSHRVLHACFAHSFRFPMDAALYFSIHLEDSLMEGKSFFLREVQIVRSAGSRKGVGGFPAGQVIPGTNTQWNG